MRQVKKIKIRKQGCRQLVLHANPSSVRNFHLKSYKTQVTSLNNANKKMRNYIEVDLPAFTFWWQQEFADLLAAQMELERKTEDSELLVSAVEQYKRHHRCTYQKAYSVLIKAKSENNMHTIMQEIFAAQDEQEEIDQKTWFEDFESSSQAFESLLKDSFYDSQPEDFHSSKTDHACIKSPEETTESYLKKLYRDLVRLLHPDAKKGGEQSPEDKSLWNDLQNAYEWRDLDRLEQIFKAIKGQGSNAIDFATIPIGDIVAMKEALAQKLSDLRLEIKHAKKEANWDFENRRKQKSFLRPLTKSIENEIIGQTLLLEFRLKKLQQRLQGWGSLRKNKKQSSSRQSSTTEPYFF